MPFQPYSCMQKILFIAKMVDRMFLLCGNLLKNCPNAIVKEKRKGIDIIFQIMC